MAKTGHNGHNGDGHGRGQVTEVPDVSYIKNIDVTHEASDVSVSGLLKFVAALTVMTILVAVLMWGLFRFFSQQENKKEPAAGPMAMTKEESLPPEPRLQAAPGFGVKQGDGQWVPLELKEPQAEFRVIREQWERQLNCEQHDTTEQHGTTQQHGTTEQHDAAGSPTCVRIDEAMKRLVQQGIPSRTQDGMARDVALPTAPSSGRR